MVQPFAGGACVLVDPHRDLMQMLGCDLLAMSWMVVIVLPGAVADRLAAGVGAGEVTRVDDCLGPCEQVGGLVGGEAAALLLVEEDDVAGREVFALGCGYGLGGVLRSERCRGDAGSLRFFYFCFEAAGSTRR